MMDLKDQIVSITQASSIASEALVQTLWSDYGQLKRFKLHGGKYPSVIVKHIQLPERSDHPRGWNTDLSHQRKLTSYQVECNWYMHFQKLSDKDCRMPKHYYIEKQENERHRITEQFGQIAHVFTTYECFNNVKDENPFMRGINTIQLLNTGERWVVVSIYFTQESEDNPIPEKYLPSK